VRYAAGGKGRLESEEANTTQTDQGYSLLNFAFLGLLKDV